MPSFRTKVRLVIAGETFDVVTNMGDQLTAERGVGEDPRSHQGELGARVWWSAFKRANPEHPAARNFRTFVDDIDAADEVEPPSGEKDGLDPTPVGASDGSAWS